MNELVTEKQALEFREHDLKKYTTLREAWEKSFNFHVVEEPLYRMSHDETGKRIFVRIPQKAITRSDNKNYLGSVGNTFKTLQPIDQVAVFEPLLESGYFDLERGFTLQGGRKCILQVGLKAGIADVIPGDSVKQLLSIVQGLDGSLSVCTFDTTIRIVCMNTLKMSLTQAEKTGRILKFKHTASLSNKISDVRGMVEKISKQFSGQIEFYRVLANKRINSLEQKHYFRRVLEISETSDVNTRIIGKLENLVEAGRGATSRTRGTLWGAFNAVTEYLDHERGRNPDSTLTNSLFGPGRSTRNNAAKEAYLLVAN